jgi:hypothetical protein
MTSYDSKSVMQRERRRLAQVRKSFAAGADTVTKGQPVPFEFLGTCVDYIQSSMNRLHAQDQRIHDILRPHVAADDASGGQILSHLSTRLTRSREALAKLVAARDAYRTAPQTGADAFKVAVDYFMDVYLNVLLSGQHSTLDMQNKVFTDATWNDVAGVTQESSVIEASLFSVVKRLAPSGMDPESFPSARPSS